MQFVKLLDSILKTHEHLQLKAVQSVNKYLVIRNWIIGYYIVEFEQNGEDRANYGEKLLANISTELKKRGIKGVSETNLKIFRQFAIAYNQFSEYFFENKYLPILQSKSLNIKDIEISQTESDESENPKTEIRQTESDESETDILPITSPEKLLRYFSYSHFVELVKIKDNIKRIFYEQQTINANWDAKTLKRQIETLLFERTALSKDKNILLENIKNNGQISNISEIIISPYVF